MFSYPFHIRDYIAKTRHLSLFEDLAYRRLLDAYYTEEQPLPSDAQACARLIAMREHATEVEAVLREFFVLTEAGWTNDRCDYELGKYKALQESGRRASALRWRGPDGSPIRKPSGTHQEPNANPMPTRKPKNQTTQEPKKPPAVPAIAFDWESGCFQNITELQRRKWMEASPGVDVDAEIKKAEVYFVSNPAKAMQYTRHGQFLSKWMAKAGGSSVVPPAGVNPSLSNPFEGLA